MIIITVARKPLSGTVAQTVQEHGTGALNIDGCRISTEGESFVTPLISSVDNRTGGDRDLTFWSRSNDERFKQAQRESIERTRSLGRWPANLIIRHSVDCTCRGQKRVKGTNNASLVNTVAGSLPTKVGAVGLKRDAPGIYGYSDAEGMETVPDWHCDLGCPVLMLDAQSGVHKSPPVDRGADRDKISGGTGACYCFAGQSPGYGDVGGASRFFKQVKR